MKLILEFGTKTLVPFVGGWAAGKVFDEMYDSSRDLLLDKDMDKQVKIKRMELRIAENERTLKQQEELIRLQRARSDDLAKQTQDQYFHLMDLKNKTKY
ncbi:MAG: hypothetical protein ACT6S0_18910 [Roseateles sp.]|uniref:hypothetical protein n=1 Tax=Roseateles sp. TaxID=1971397 RepID=UPI004036D44D